MEVDGVYGECRCCSSKGYHRDLFKEYHFQGIRRVYSEIFVECYNFNLSQNPHLTSLICIECVKKLREANSFKLQAINTERQLLECLATRAEDRMAIDTVNTADTESTNTLDVEDEHNLKVECWPLELPNEECPDGQDTDLNAEDTNEDNESSDNDTSDDDKSSQASTSLDIADKTTIPAKSRVKYEKAYQDFANWKSTKNLTSVNEDVVLMYFEELVKKFKSSSLWAIYSMLKCMLIIHHNQNMSNYTRVIALLKQKAQLHISKKSKTFTTDEINQFLNQAPNEMYLATKIILILGIMGGCRRKELYNICFTDVQIIGPTILIKINNEDATSTRTFSITGRHYELCRKYMALRPKHCTTPGFFLGYRSGKCVPQRIGINTFSMTGKIVASYLNLPNPKLYTSQCFRRTNAALMINTAKDLSSLIRLSLAKEAAEGSRAQESNQTDILGENNELAVTAGISDKATISAETSHFAEPITDIDWNEGTDLLDNSCEDPDSSASNIVDHLALQSKSKRKYEKVYKDFMEWRPSKKFKTISEECVLTYFQELAEKCRSSSLWSMYSMLKTTLGHKNVDISKYSKVTSLIKRLAKGETNKIYKTLKPEEIKRFLEEAPDHIYLSKKVMLIFGVIGACRCLDLYNIQLSDVQTFGKEMILVKINNPEKRTSRSFSVTGRYCDPCFKYMDLRPEGCDERGDIPAFFIAYRYGRCVSQRIGINMFGNVGRVIANYLHLPDPEAYVGQCFRRTAATISMSVDGDFISIKRKSRTHYPSKSSLVTVQDTKDSEKRIDDCDNIKDIRNDVVEIKVEPWELDHADALSCFDDQCDDTNPSESTQNNSDIVGDMKDEADLDIEDSWLQSMGDSGSHVPHLDVTEDTNKHSKESDSDTSVDETSLDSSTGTGRQLLQKTRKRYEKAYSDFMKWRESHSHTSFSEDVVYVYFEELSKKVQSPTLWVVYSMLKSTLGLHHNVDLSNYNRVLKMIKIKAAGHICKKSKIFTADDVRRFLDEAPDEIYLSKKIILIFGIMGACRTYELYNLLYTDVEIYGSTILVKLNNVDTKTTRTFSITGRFAELCKKYIYIRPEHCIHLGFFLDYRSGKCTTQRVGKNAFGNVGKTIALFLQLPDPELYTGQCFRKTAETVWLSADGNVIDLKRNGKNRSR